MIGIRKHVDKQETIETPVCDVLFTHKASRKPSIPDKLGRPWWETERLYIYISNIYIFNIYIYLIYIYTYVFVYKYIYIYTCI